MFIGSEVFSKEAAPRKRRGPSETPQVVWLMTPRSGFGTGGDRLSRGGNMRPGLRDEDLDGLL